MGKFKQWGVDGITKATAEIYFAYGEESCQFCPCLETYARPMCRLTAELVVDTRGRGYHCPLKFEGGNNEIISPTETE